MKLADVHVGINKRRGKKRVGRGPGSKKGRYATRGVKGQYQTVGDQPALLKEGGQMPLFMRLPQRGFSNNAFRPVVLPVNVGVLESFEAGTEVTLELLKARGFAQHPHDRVKILADGELTKKLTVSAHAFSKQAREKIEKAGGTCVVVPAPHRGPKIKNKMRPRRPKG